MKRMLRISNRGFKRSYVYGGSGIFDSFARTISSVLGKEVVKRAATQAVQKVATEAGKKLGEKGVQKVSSLISPRLTSKSEDILIKHIKLPSGPLNPERSFAGPLDPERSSSEPTLGLTSKSQNILRKYKAPPPPPSEENFNLNALIDGSAIRIEDYIKQT